MKFLLKEGRNFQLNTAVFNTSNFSISYTKFKVDNLNEPSLRSLVCSEYFYDFTFNGLCKA